MSVGTGEQTVSLRLCTSLSSARVPQVMSKYDVLWEIVELFEMYFHVRSLKVDNGI